MAPALSIVIPAYNVEVFIEAAVRSALRQSSVDAEVIVVDDGSTDATRSRVEAIRDPRVRLIVQSNWGLAGARNTGIRHASGRYIGFLDGDDVWLPSLSARLIAEIEDDPGLGGVYSGYRYINEAGRPAGGPLFTGPREPSLRQMLRRNCANSHIILRRDCLQQAGMFNEELRSCEDYELCVRILAKTSFRLRSVPVRLALYRVRSGSLTGDFAQFLRNAERAIELIAAHVPSASPRILRQCRAECYRIASRKALAGRQLAPARKHLSQAFALSPLLLFDIRAVGTACLVIASSCVPSSLAHLPYDFVRRLVVACQELVARPR